MKNQPLIYPGLKVAIMGLGITGRSALRYCLHLGAEIFVSDCRPHEQFIAEEEELLATADIKWEAGGHTSRFLGGVELILVSPGVNLQLPLFTVLRDRGVRFAGELAVAAGQIDVPVVAVTGTNGKTTVTTLIGEILEDTGKKVFVGGNIGTPLYDYLLRPDGYDIVVAEVSSFQLESGGEFSPDVALLLNISPDHLDRHSSMDNYQQAKMQLFKYQGPDGVAVVYGDDPSCLKLPEGIQSVVRSFGRDVGCTARIVENGISVNIAEAQEEYAVEALGVENDLMLLNYAAAIVAVRSLECSYSETLAGLKGFRPLPHRMEFVAEVEGVSYYNDSKATNTGAVIGALAQFNKNVILLAGGRDKGDDYRLLRESVQEKVRTMVVFGESAGLLSDALADLVPLIQVDSMANAVVTAAKNAHQGDVVLLSPACASFDMFTGYGHRGNEFKKAVQALENTLS